MESRPTEYIFFNAIYPSTCDITAKTQSSHENSQDNTYCKRRSSNKFYNHPCPQYLVYQAGKPGEKETDQDQGRYLIRTT